MADIQILIAAFGPEAIEKIAGLHHALHPAVEYLVSWQNYDVDRIPGDIKNRKDFKIFLEDSSGLCNNRNALLRRADAPIVVISDDDLIYTSTHIENLLKAFRENLDSHFLALQYESEKYPKQYPATPFDLRHPPKNYFVTSMELAFNLERIKRDFASTDDIFFNPAFGVNGSLFGSGEEDILICRLLKRNFRGSYVPLSICINTDSTTSEREMTSQGFIETKGAVISYVKPSTSRLRMLSHAWRAHKSEGEGHISFFTYCNWWLKGAKKARKHRVFENY